MVVGVAQEGSVVDHQCRVAEGPVVALVRHRRQVVGLREVDNLHINAGIFRHQRVYLVVELLVLFNAHHHNEVGRVRVQFGEHGVGVGL